jgi:heat shock protein HtpX
MQENLYTNADSNVRKTWGLMLGFLILVAALGYVISYLQGSYFILVIATIFALVMNFVAYWKSDRIVLRIHKAKPVTREEYFDLWNDTENLAITAGLPMPRLYVIEDPSPNAFATGRDPEHGVICVTSGLLSMLDKAELEGVIAHEMSHIGNKDILFSTAAIVLVGFASLASQYFFRSTLFGRSDEKEGGGVLVILGIIFIILAPISAKLLELAVSRKREFLADASGALLTRYPEGLARALMKISSTGIPMQIKNSATSHLFIANPFGREKPSFVSNLFSTHPPVEVRIKALVGDEVI